MNTKHVNITLDEALYKKLKVWTAQNDMTLLAAGTALLTALANGDPRALALVGRSESPAPPPLPSSTDPIHTDKRSTAKKPPARRKRST